MNIKEYQEYLEETEKKVKWLKNEIWSEEETLQGLKDALQRLKDTLQEQEKRLLQLQKEQ